jgi:prophage antirepressor-like protein
MTFFYKQNKIMSENLMKFDFSGKVFRTINKNGNVFFCLADVCGILGINNVSMAKSRLQKDGVITAEGVVKTGEKADGTTYEQKGVMTFINEANFYKTVLQSRKPVAEPFTDYVCMEVLPSIRKTGGYIVERPGERDEDLFARALLVAGEKIRQQEERICVLEKQNCLDKSKIQYYEKMMQSKNTYTSTRIAWELGIGDAKELHLKLKAMEILFKQSGQWMLNAEYCGKDYTESKTYSFTNKRTGTEGTVSYMVWTEKGREFLHKIFEKTNLL